MCVTAGERITILILISPGVVAGGKAKRVDYSDYEWSIDNMLKWNRTFVNIHNFDFTFVYTLLKNIRTGKVRETMKVSSRMAHLELSWYSGRV